MSVVRRTLARILSPARDWLARPVLERQKRADKRSARLERQMRRWSRTLVDARLQDAAPAQVALAAEWRRLVREKVPLPSFREVGFGVHSEGDEDGILLFLFAVLGAPLRSLVDVGAGWIRGSNTANLLLHHGWTGLLIEAVEDQALELERYYRQHPATDIHPPRVVAQRITRDNADRLIREGLETRDADLLCIDIDGVDYWIWEAITCIRPRVVVVEYQNILGPEVAWTVPYREDFVPEFAGRFGVYNGASLGAFVKLGRAKGYRLVGCQKYGYNAFFVRDDLAPDLLPEVHPARCFDHPFVARMQREFGELARSREWVEV